MEIKADLHIHTNKSNDGVHSLPEIVMAAKACGLAAIAVADHNLSYLPANFMHTDTELLLIPACEVSTTDGHILGLFLDEPL
ncbi:MAG: PHP domain-containing protein, partial [Clostridia bacterium]|nr:PHP domain-containing protein [Clostridia bacterium]